MLTLLTLLCSVKSTGRGRWLVGIKQGTVESGKPEMIISFPGGSSSSGTLVEMSETMSSGNGYKNHLMKDGRGNLGHIEKWR